MALLGLDRYRGALANRGLRTALLLGLLLRVPVFAGSVVLTLHVVGHLDRSYGAAGGLAAAATLCIAISGPWRGRLLDRTGLRRVVLPSMLITAACWAVAPFVEYWPLLVLAAISGLFAVPVFSITRQSVIAAVQDADRRTALSLDSMFVEFSFMIGPLLGVWLATLFPTSWVLFGVEMTGVAAAAVLLVVDPPLQPTDAETIPAAGVAGDPDGSGVAIPAEFAADVASTTAPATAAADATATVTGAATGRSGSAAEPAASRSAAPVSRRDWFRGPLVAQLLAAVAVTVVLAGCDIAIVAALRAFGQSSLIGPVLAIWGAGSVIGGFLYGALHRPVTAFALLAGLSLVTFPVALSGSALGLTVLIFIAGLLCAPTITATVDRVSHLVPAAARGEAMGWHGSSMTIGAAVGAPLSGVAIDSFGWQGGFVAVAAVGLVGAAVGWLASVRSDAVRAVR